MGQAGGQGSPSFSKFKLGPPDGYEGIFVNVGGQDIFYLTVFYLNLYI